MKELGLTADLLNSVTGVLKDSSIQRAEQSKIVGEKLDAQYANRMGVARPRTAEEARQATLEGRAPQRRISDSITQVYAKSVAEHNARVKEEAAAIEKAYAKMGASKPISESVVQVDEKEYVMPYNSKKTTSSSERYKSVIAHAKKMGYSVHHQDTKPDSNSDKADITVRYQGGENRHESDPESIEIHKSGKAHGDKVLHAIAGGKASAVKEELTVDEACSSMKAKKAEEESNKARKAKQREAVDESEHITESTVKGSESGDRYEMKSFGDGTASIVKTHQGGKSLKNEHGGYPTYKTGKKSYIQKHFDKLGEEVTLSAEELATIAELAKKFEEQ